jgi:hypothetical protein
MTTQRRSDPCQGRSATTSTGASGTVPQFLLADILARVVAIAETDKKEERDQLLADLEADLVAVLGREER